MYDLARKTRAERRAKAERLGASTERKTDSSDWTPAEPLNADVKTGARPVSRRAYKSGGKVEGCGAKANMGRKPRKTGGRAEGAKDYAEAKVNRNVKDANEKRAGIKHVGGFKEGGRTKKNNGGASPTVTQQSGGIRRTMFQRLKDALGLDSPDYAPKMGDKKPEAPKMDEAERARLAEMAAGEGRKRGGRAKKADGGGRFVPNEAGLSPLEQMKALKSLKKRFDVQNMDTDRSILQQIVASEKPYQDIEYTLGVKRSQMEQKDPSYNKGQGPTKDNASNLEFKRDMERRREEESERRARSEEFDRRRSGRKHGGRSHKAEGGNIVERANKMLDQSAKTAGVPNSTMSFGRVQKGSMSPARAVGMKKGGKAHTDEAMDRALIKKMVKPEARKGKAGGGKAGQFVRGETREDRIETAKNAADLIGEKTIKKGQALGSNYTPEDFEKYLRSSEGSVIANRAFMDEINSPRKAGGRIKRKDGGSVENRTVHKTDGEFHYPEKDYGQLASTSAMTRKVQDRTPLKTGGRAKGKTDINIYITAGGKQMPQDGMMPPPGMDMMPPPGMDMGLPPGLPVPVPGAAAPAAAAPPPMPMPVPMPMPMPPEGAMPRKSGGRVKKQVGGSLSPQPLPVAAPQGNQGGDIRSMMNPLQLNPSFAAQMQSAPQGNQGSRFQSMMNSMRQNPQAFNQTIKNVVERRAAPVGQQTAQPRGNLGGTTVNPQRTPGAAPAAAPAAAPMPRKSGGRAMSYKDMTAGSGSGEGRLQKTDIAEYKREKRRAGGKVYKSYEDMDAGAGSGLGRLEKTEIQARKR